MMAGRFDRAGIGIACLLLAGACASGAPPEKLSGSIAVYVTNTTGMPQMGATVLLFNGVDRMVHRALTDEAGSFLFDSLPAGAYSIQVSLASFLPAIKRNIGVQPGMRSLLSVNLAGVLSSIELVYSAKGSKAIMSDDWKWVLRSSNATRPVLRFGPRITVVGQADSSAGLFSQTRGMVKVSAGDQGSVSQFGNEPDLGTAFALATSVFGNNQVHVSGNFGYSAATGVPSAGFRTSYSRGPEGSKSAQVNLTMRQWYLPARVGAGLISAQQGAAPALRTMSVGFLDRKELAEGLLLEYGFSLESVSFLSTLNYFSPYGRLTYDLGPRGAVEVAFNSGLPPAQFFAQAGVSSDLQQDLAALSLFPRVSLRGGRARVQRAENLEIAYRSTIGSRTYALAAYLESMSNAALTMVAPAGAVPPSDLLPDLLSNSAVFNVGDYSSAGYMASVTQGLGNNMNVSLTGGSGGALIPSQGELVGGSPDDLRRVLRHGQRRWLALRFSATAPKTRTQFTTSYRWADGRALTAPHAYLTGASLYSDIGWNLHFRQPMPWASGMRGRLEITGDMRNLLGEGYLPLSTGLGRRALLVHTPRGVRGGFNFIF